MKDAFGHELVVGDDVAYVTRKSSSIYIKRGTVVFGTGPYDGRLRVRKADTNNVVAISRLDHVFKVIPVPTVEAAETVDDPFGG